MSAGKEGQDPNRVEEQLASYPTLDRFINPAQGRMLEDADLVLSDLELVRWFRRTGWAEELARVDQLLAEFEDTGRSATWATTIVRDPPAFWSALAEMHVAHSLKSRGCQIDLSRLDGPDLWIRTGIDLAPLPVEITGSRSGSWIHRFEQGIDAIAFQHSLSFHVESLIPNRPKDFNLDVDSAGTTVRAVLAEMKEAVTNWLSSTGDDSRLEADCPTLNMRAVFEKNETNGRRFGSAPFNGSNPLRLGDTIAYALQSKARRSAVNLPTDQAVAVVFSTFGYLDFEISHFFDAFDHDEPARWPINWSVIPKQVQWIIPYRFAFYLPAPFQAICLENPIGAHRDEPSAEWGNALFRSLFPRPLGPQNRKL